MLIDTHTHIYCEEFDDDRNETIDRAVAAGVLKMILPAIDENTTQRQDELAKQRPDLFLQMAGLHPTSVGDDYEKNLAIVEKRIAGNPDKYAAVGEIGLDLYWDTTYAEQQKEALKRQIRLAQNYGKAIALHVRNAQTETFEVLEDINSPHYKGVMHCFSGTIDEALKAIEMGFYIGIGGTLTYKKSQLPAIVQNLPTERIVLETDAPYLSPTPHRGHRNEPSYIALTAQALAAIMQKNIAEIEEITTANAKLLFDIK